jgi:hypothetical protein
MKRFVVYTTIILLSFNAVGQGYLTTATEINGPGHKICSGKKTVFKATGPDASGEWWTNNGSFGKKWVYEWNDALWYYAEVTLGSPGSAEIKKGNVSGSFIVNNSSVVPGTLSSKTICKNENAPSIELSGEDGDVVGWYKRIPGSSGWTEILSNGLPIRGTTLLGQYVSNTTAYEYVVEVASHCDPDNTEYSSISTITIIDAESMANSEELKGTGSYCDGGEGAKLIIYDPPPELTYYLFREGEPSHVDRKTYDERTDRNGAVFIEFAPQTIEGTYSAKASHEECPEVLYDVRNSIEVSKIQPPTDITITTPPYDPPQDVCSTGDIEFRVNKTGTGFSWKIYDQSRPPQKLKEFATGNVNKLDLDLSDFPTGAYNMQVSFTHNYGCGSADLISTFRRFSVEAAKTLSVEISGPTMPICANIEARYEAEIISNPAITDIEDRFDYQWKLIPEGGSVIDIGTNQPYFEASDFSNLDQIYCEIILKPDSTLDDLCIIFDPVSNKQTIAIRDIPDQPIVNGYNGECGEQVMTIHAATPIVGNGEDISHNWYNADGSVVAEGTFEVERPDEYEVHVTKWQNTFSNGESYSVTTINGDACESDPVEFTIDLGSTPSVTLTAFACNPSYIVPTQLTIKMENAPVGSTFDIYRHEINSSGHDEYYSLGSTSSNEFVYDNYYLNYTNEIYVVMNDPASCDDGTYRQVYIENMTLSEPVVSGRKSICSGTDLSLTIENTTNGEFNWFQNGEVISNDHTLFLENVTTPLSIVANYTKVGTIGTCESPEAIINVRIIDDAPEPPTVSAFNMRCGTGEISIQALGSYEQFIWYDADDNLIGDGSSSIVATLSVLDVPTIFKVKGVLMQGCESETIEFIALATSNCENYIHITTITEEGHQPGEDLRLLDINVKDDNWTYFDGLGRAMQSVAQQSTPSGNDFIQPIIYDEFGREATQYLPYQANRQDGYYNSLPVGDNTGTNPYNLSPQYQFYQSGGTLASDTHPYAKTVFEPSPLNRVLSQGAAGEVWQPENGHAIGYTYQANATDEVVQWEMSPTAVVDGLYQAMTSSQHYVANELWVSIVEDENGNLVREYKDKQDKVILKKVEAGPLAEATEHDGWACTYYVYDHFDNLRYVIPPQAVQQMVDANDWSLVENADFINRWMFYYDYDERQRMTIKKVPGARPVYMVYDKRDRLILTQDGNQRSTQFGDASGKQWLFTKYDALNRPIITGIYTHNGPETTQAAMQQDVVDAAIVDGADFYEWPDADGQHGYTNQMFPTNATEIHSVTYYDNYSFLGQQWFDDENLDFSYDNSLNTALQPSVANQAVKGQVTAGKVKVLDPDGTGGYLNSVSYYDDRYRVIQIITENHLGSTERTTNCFDDLTVLVKESYSTSTMTDAPATHRRFSYDHAQRLQYVEHSIDGGAFVKIAENHYNELGELVKKDLHQADDGESWQSVDYRYNIRGWLTHINDATLSDDPSDLFGMELYYNSGFDVPAYNGNISGVKWKSAIDNDRMAYGYMYDKLNRLVSADYVKGTNSSSWEDEGFYNMEIRGAALGNGAHESGYDLNGNILNLKRYGVVDGHQAAIDVLTYDYSGLGNQLKNVSDEGTDEGFKDGTTDINSDGLDYLYDDNGNMIADDNKEIERIDYNFLNLPMVIDMTDGRKIAYIYDAAGIKLAQRVYEDDTQAASRVTNYIGERIYETKAGEPQKLQFLHHEEGRIVRVSPLEGGAGGWNYQYHLKDHLGNTRLTFGAPETTTYIATMEEGENRLIEENEMGFENITNTEWSDANLDHTHIATDQNGDAIMPGHIWCPSSTG